MSVSANEHIWVRIHGEDGVLRFVITSDYRRENYYIYKALSGDNLVKIGKGKDPIILEQKFVN